MACTGVLAAVIGATELFFELLENYEREHHGKNHSRTPPL